MDVSGHGLGNFEHVLEIDLQKDGLRLIIVALKDVLPHCSANIERDPCLWISNMNWEILRLCWGKALARIWQHCFSAFMPNTHPFLTE